MENISNAKIDKLRVEIEKNRARLAEYQEKVDKQEKLLIAYEDAEIVARYRKQIGNEDTAAKLRNNSNNGGGKGVISNGNNNKNCANNSNNGNGNNNSNNNKNSANNNYEPANAVITDGGAAKTNKEDAANDNL